MKFVGWRTLLFTTLLATSTTAGAPRSSAAENEAPADTAAADTTMAAPDTTSAVAPADTSRRVTGTHFRFGGTVDMAQRYGDFPLSRTAGRRGEVARAGPGRWMGIDGKLTLFFLRGHLTRVAFEAEQPSPRAIDFAQDELRRSGYRKVCETGPTNCTWFGASKITLEASRTSLSATVEPPPPARPKPKAPVVMVPDVLVLGREATTSKLAKPTVVTSPAPEYPAGAQTDRVQGNVWVRALVNEQGEVLSASVTRSIPELDAAAIRNAMRWRFEPYRLDGVPARFEVEFPVRFVLNF